MANDGGELKKRARLAKQRLKMGYWESLKGSSEATNAEVRVRLRRELETANVSDEQLYRRVCDILERDEVIINPIGQLIDDEVYKTLDPSGKQRYILELSNKFRELKERYYREKTGS